MEMMLAALTVEAATGASTRVKGLSMKFETTKMAMTAKTTFLKDRRGLRGVKCILGRSPCVASDLCVSLPEPARSAIPICTSPAMHGVGGYAWWKRTGAQLLNEHSLSKP